MIVKELIAKLNDFPDDLPVVIHDVDTDWLLNIEFVQVEQNAVAIQGNYFGDDAIFDNNYD